MNEKPYEIKMNNTCEVILLSVAIINVASTATINPARSINTISCLSCYVQLILKSPT